MKVTRASAGPSLRNQQDRISRCDRVELMRHEIGLVACLTANCNVKFQPMGPMLIVLYTVALRAGAVSA